MQTSFVEVVAKCRNLIQKEVLYITSLSRIHPYVITLFLWILCSLIIWLGSTYPIFCQNTNTVYPRGIHHMTIHWKSYRSRLRRSKDDAKDNIKLSLSSIIIITPSNSWMKPKWNAICELFSRCPNSAIITVSCSYF